MQSGGLAWTKEKAVPMREARGRVEGQSGHPGSSRRKGRPMTTGRGRNGRSGTRRAKKVNRARKRRNKILFVMIIILLIMILAAGAVFFKRYGSSNEEADKEQYYGIENSDDLALIINNEVVKKEESSAESSSDSSTDSVIPGKVFDGQYYVAYQVLRDKINSRFYWDANERVLLYTLPDGNVSVSENSSEYTAVNETKSEIMYYLRRMEISHISHFRSYKSIRIWNILWNRNQTEQLSHQSGARSRQQK